MLTINIECDVLSDRRVTIQLPETVHLGRHELVVVVGEQATTPAAATEQKLNDFIKRRYELSLSESKQGAEKIFTQMAVRHAG